MGYEGLWRASERGGKKGREPPPKATVWDGESSERDSRVAGRGKGRGKGWRDSRVAGWERCAENSQRKKSVMANARHA